MMSSYTTSARLSRGFKKSIDRGGFVRQLDLVLLGAVALLLIIGSLLVSASTRDWYDSQGLDPHFYLKRHLLNIVIGIFLAAMTAAVDYRLLRAYTPVLWGLAVIGLIAGTAACTSGSSHNVSAQTKPGGKAARYSPGLLLGS